MQPVTPLGGDRSAPGLFMNTHAQRPLNPRTPWETKCGSQPSCALQHIFSFVYTCCTAVFQSRTCPDNLSPGSKPVPTPQNSSSTQRQAVAHTDPCWVWFCTYWFVYQQMTKFIWNAPASEFSVGRSHSPGKATGQIPDGVSEGMTSGRERGLSSVAESQGLLHGRP